MISQKFVGFFTLVIFFITFMFVSLGYLIYYLFGVDFGIFSSFEILTVAIVTFISFSSCLVIYFILKKFFSYTLWGILFTISLFLFIGIFLYLDILIFSHLFLFFPICLIFIFIQLVEKNKYFDLDKFIILNSFLLLFLALFFSILFYVSYDNSGFIDDYVVLLDVVNDNTGDLVLPYQFNSFADGFTQGYIKSCQNNQVINCITEFSFSDNFEIYLLDLDNRDLFDIENYKLLLEKEFSDNISFKILKIFFIIVISFILISSSVIVAIFGVIIYYVLEYFFKLISWILDPLNLEKY